MRMRAEYARESDVYALRSANIKFFIFHRYRLMSALLTELNAAKDDPKSGHLYLRDLVRRASVYIGQLETERAALDLKSIWDQASGGVHVEHNCPAMYACAAIIADYVTAGYCANCFADSTQCNPSTWKLRRKCCPDCTHGSFRR